MESSKTGEDLFTMANPARRYSGKREEQRGFAPSLQALLDTMNHMKSLKLKDHLGENVADCYDTILVDVKRLESAGAFRPEHLSYIICIVEDTSHYRSHL